MWFRSVSQALLSDVECRLGPFQQSTPPAPPAVEAKQLAMNIAVEARPSCDFTLLLLRLDCLGLHRNKLSSECTGGAVSEAMSGRRVRGADRLRCYTGCTQGRGIEAKTERTRGRPLWQCARARRCSFELLRIP